MFRANIKILSILTLFLAVLTLSGSAAAETYFSAPNKVMSGENATFIVEESETPRFNANITISNSVGEKYNDSLTATNGVASTTVNISEIGLSAGEYTVNVSIRNQSANLQDFISSSFSVSPDLSGAVMVHLTSKDISSSECPLDKSSSMNGECKLFGVEMTEDTSSNLVNVSKSGKPLTSTLNGGSVKVGLVDTEEKGNYETVFWDDDNTFREDNETGKPEKSFLTPGETVKEFKIGNSTAKLSAEILEDDIVLGVPPTSDEIPYRKGDTIDYAFLGYRSADSTLGLAIDAEPVQGKSLKATGTNLRTEDRKELSVSNSTTNKYGFTGTGQIQNAEVGRYKVT